MMSHFWPASPLAVRLTTGAGALTVADCDELDDEPEDDVAGRALLPCSSTTWLTAAGSSLPPPPPKPLKSMNGPMQSTSTAIRPLSMSGLPGRMPPPPVEGGYDPPPLGG